MTKGYRTSEFWLASAATVVGMLIASGAIADSSPVGKGIALIASALAAAGYSYSRALVKGKPDA
jgi:drug/metabolite transporter (DMT)-like permease